MFAKPLNVVLAEWIKIPSEGLNPLLDRKLHERLVFTNPDYESRHNRGEWIGNIPPQISCMRQKGRNYLLPRGFLDQFLELCRKFQQPYRLSDRRRSFDPAPLEFHGQLKSYQQDAAEAVLEKDFSTLVGGHKSGKTVIALYTISQRSQPTLVLIPRLDLLDGWLSKIESFLQIPSSEVGTFTGGVHQVGNLITIAHTGEIMRYWRKLSDRIGYIIADECQRCPSKVFTHLVPNFDCRYMLGLSNTAQRKDRLSKLVYYYMGDVVYTINEKDAREGRGIIHANVVARPTQFEYSYNSRGDYASMIRALVKDEERTRLIVDDIEAELKEQSEPVIVLGDEDQHRILKAELQKRNIGVESVVVEKKAAEDGAKPDEGVSGEPVDVKFPTESPVVLVTPQVLAQYSGGLSSKVLFLAVPVYFRKNLAGAIQSLSSNGGEKRLKIYDYVDTQVGLLENYFRMRSYNYGIHPSVLLSESSD
jgi:hypothetical protein